MDRIGIDEATKSAIMGKKFAENYAHDEFNFAADGELTVKITLAEYRYLLQELAKLEARYYEVSAKLRVLTQENQDTPF